MAKLSATPLAAIDNFLPNPPIRVPVGDGAYVDFTGATILSGPSFAGPGTALDLAMYVDAGGRLVLPDGDAMYDVEVNVVVACDPADNGKMVRCDLSCFEVGDSQVWVPIIDGEARAVFTGTFMVFAGDAPVQFGVQVMGLMLSQDAAITRVYQLHVTKRT